jgi:hypothetical protein
MTATLLMEPPQTQLPIDEPSTVREPGATPQALSAFRLQANMRRGTGASVPATWTSYSSLDRARQAARDALRDDRVVQVMVVTDTLPPRFVEWVR